MFRSPLRLALCVFAFSLFSVLACAAEPIEIPLWPDGAPGAPAQADPESWVNNDKNGGQDNHVRNVNQPSVKVFLPDPDKATGAAVVICPGGGYHILAIDKEGNDIARWLNQFGVAGIVLKYRLPHPDGAPAYAHDVPLRDAQRAIALTRSKAAEWKLEPDRIGIMGFSAGGHLASTASTHFNKGKADAPDPIDRLNCRPDFSILIYPVISFQNGITHTGSRENLIGANAKEDLVRLYSNELQVTAETPPAFLIHTEDDPVSTENSLVYYQALRKAQVPAEMHLYPKGGHGYGILQQGETVNTWPKRCEEWMAKMGWLEKKK
jgi:acetyl esterase/lipase